MTTDRFWQPINMHTPSLQERVWRCPEASPTLCFYSDYEFKCKSHSDCPGYQMCCLMACAYGCVRPLPIPKIDLKKYFLEKYPEFYEGLENNSIDTEIHASTIKNRNSLSNNGFDEAAFNISNNLIDTGLDASTVQVNENLANIGFHASDVDINDNLIDTGSHSSVAYISDNEMERNKFNLSVNNSDLLFESLMTLTGLETENFENQKSKTDIDKKTFSDTITQSSNIATYYEYEKNNLADSYPNSIEKNGLMSNTFLTPTFLKKSIKVKQYEGILHRESPKLHYRSPYNFDKVNDTNKTGIFPKNNKENVDSESLHKHLLSSLIRTILSQKNNTPLFNRFSISVVNWIKELDDMSLSENVNYYDSDTYNTLIHRKYDATNSEIEVLRKRLLHFLARANPLPKINRTLLDTIFKSASIWIDGRDNSSISDNAYHDNGDTQNALILRKYGWLKIHVIDSP
ncbi:WAP domain-containing protein [Nephila pilipes]|uniref:WAP domain-containing protein n=1 Tax=Nephila pilipes TaxID=299642 RepID=A0A8X6TRR1_NEPPI|nr:WAP domain-containing protein [Nephila pilipes]